MDLPLGKKSIFGRNTNVLLKVPINLVCPTMSPETRFRPLKGPGTNKNPRKDEVRVREKQKRL